MRIPCLIMALAAAAGAADSALGDVGEPSEEYKKDRAELENMLARRDMDLYELQFEPMQMDRVVLRNRLGREKAYDYLVFRIRNQVTDSTERLALKAKGYNEVLASVAEQYAIAKVEQGDGVRLRVDGVEGADGVILERQEAKPRTRTAHLSASAWNEHGSRLHLLGEITDGAERLTWERETAALRAERRDGDVKEPPTGRPDPMFADPGDPDAQHSEDEVRRAVEERFGRRLLTAGELRARPLPPFDGVARIQVADIESPEYAMNGWFVGEAYGVFVFDALSYRGRSITLAVNGLSNKMRRDPKQAEPEAGKVDNYFQRRWLRRSYQLQFERRGDEYYRDQDPFRMVRSGWTWQPAFVRLDAKREIAYGSYFLDNIRQAANPDMPDTQVEGEFWPMYESSRTQRAAAATAGPDSPRRLPDLQNTDLKAKGDGQ
ncbi:MAG: hypothetical protein RLZZ127_1872 [Planctomycetota bacterium]|jgi:hypothetical protein